MKKIIILIVALVWMTGAKGQWFLLNPNDTAYCGQMYFTDANTGYVSTSGSWADDTILKTTDGGVSWIPQYISEQEIVAIFFPDANTGYAIERIGIYPGYHHKIVKTTNGGLDWSPTSFDTEEWGLQSIFFTGTNTGYAVGWEGQYNNCILKTTDGGINWVTQLNEPGDPLSSIFFIDSNTGYALGSKFSVPMHRTIWKTSNGGIDWIPVLDEYGPALESVFFTSADTGYVAGIYDLLKTTDGGINWFNLSYGTNMGIFRSLFFTDANTGYAVGSEESIYGKFIIKTTDGGTNWFVQSVNLPDYLWLQTVFLPVTDTGYIVSDHGILKTLNGGGLPVDICEKNKTGSDISIYPNPTNDKMTILGPQITSNTRFSIFNVSGEKVMERQLTDSETHIDISALPRGLYFVRVQDERMVEVTKLMKQ